MPIGGPLQRIGEQLALNLRRQVEDSIDDQLEPAAVTSECGGAREKMVWPPAVADRDAASARFAPSRSFAAFILADSGRFSRYQLEAVSAPGARLRTNSAYRRAPDSHERSPLLAAADLAARLYRAGDATIDLTPSARAVLSWSTTIPGPGSISSAA